METFRATAKHFSEAGNSSVAKEILQKGRQLYRLGYIGKTELNPLAEWIKNYQPIFDAFNII